MQNKAILRRINQESGMTLYLVAGGMLVLTGILGVCIDLVAFYTVRSEAQRAADAAALAGARVFVVSGCTGGASGTACTSGTIRSAASAQAAAIGNANKIAGQSPNIGTGDPTFSADSNSSYNPRITVPVQVTAPTYFARIFGITNVTVSAQATAEAYNPTGGGTANICLSCLKPFIGVDCDTGNVVPNSNPNANTNCAVTGSTSYSYIFNPSSHAIVRPGLAPSGIIGSSITLHGEAGPGDYETIDLGQGNGSGITTAITSCWKGSWGCGDQVQLVPGKKVGLVTPAVQTLIHENNGCSTNDGQDTIAVTPGSTPPLTITGGSNNPYGLAGKTTSTSDSIVTVPVYDGTSTGNGSNTTFTIIGFMQLFLTDACHSGKDDNVSAVVMNVLSCQTTSAACNASGPGGFVTGGGATAIPIRLVQPQ